MAPDSLVDMARRTCARNIRNLYSIGALRVELIKPLLSKIENPDQLHALEVNSPSVIGHTKDAWLSLLKRNIPNLETRLPENWQTTLFADENADRWFMIYKKLRKQVDKEVAARDKQLAIQLADSNTKVVAPVVDRPPGSVVQIGRNKYERASAAYLTSLYKGGKPGGPGFFQRVGASNRARRAAKMSTPTHLLKPRMMNGVTNAPAALVEELRHRKAMEAEQREREKDINEQKRRAEAQGKTVKPPRAMGATSFGMDSRESRAGPKVAKPPLHGGNYDLTRDREERLRALKAGKAPPQPSSREIAKLTADFLEDDQDDGDDGDHSDETYQRPSTRIDYNDDDLFDEKPKSKKRSPVKSEPPLQRQQHRESPKPTVQTSSPIKKPVSAPAPPTSHMGPIIRKRKDPPTLFRPSKR